MTSPTTSPATLDTTAQASPAAHGSTAASTPLHVGRLPRSAAFYLQASIILFFLAGSSAPTPIYSIYQAEWGFTPIITTVVFGAYALAVLASLLTVGSLSDHVGRRPVMITAIAVQAATMLVFASASGVPELLVARVVQGLSTGAVMGAVGAGLLDLDKAKGTVANSVGALAGTATGSIASGVLVQFMPAPTHLVYLVLFAIFVIQGIGVALMSETSTVKPGAVASLRIQLGLPAGIRTAILLAIPALVAVWSLAGFYGSLGPAVLRTMTGSTSHLLGGLPLFTIAASGAVTVLLVRNATPHRTLRIGTIALLVGVGLTLVALSTTSTTVFFVGAAVAGVGFGAGFQGAMRSVIPLAAPHERSKALSVMYVVSYLAMGLPAVIGGVLVVAGGGLLTTASEYGAAVMVFAALALVGSLVRTRSHPPVATPAARASCPALVARDCTANAG